MIFDFIEKPSCKPVNEIPETEIKSELKKIISLLGQKGIGIDTICKVDDRELYRFITEELFLEETDDMMVKGMTHHFIYEEFHPNHEHDIKAHCKEFIDGLLSKKVSLKPSFMAMAEEIDANGGVIKQENVVKKMEVFREAFSSFKLKHFKIVTLNIAEDVAEVSFDINFIGIIEGTNESTIFSGRGDFRLKYEYNYWCISKINIPEISI